MLRKLFPMVVVCLFFAAAAEAQTLNEKQTSFEIVDGSGLVKLAIENPTELKTVPIKLELLDPDDKIRATAIQSDKHRGPGPQNVSVSQSTLGDILQRKMNILGWFRLRYHIGGEARHRFIDRNLP